MSSSKLSDLELCRYDIYKIASTTPETPVNRCPLIWGPDELSSHVATTRHLTTCGKVLGDRNDHVSWQVHCSNRLTIRIHVILFIVYVMIKVSYAFESYRKRRLFFIHYGMEQKRKVLPGDLSWRLLSIPEIVLWHFYQSLQECHRTNFSMELRRLDIIINIFICSSRKSAFGNSPIPHSTWMHHIARPHPGWLT